MRLQLDRIGTVGVFITALTSPCCFPLLGFILTAFGLGSFELLGGWTMWAFQGLVLVSVVGSILSYSRNKYLAPLLITVASAILIFYSYHFIDAYYWSWVLYTGMFGLLLAAGVNYYKMRNTNNVVLSSVITCPVCGYSKKESMPENACQYFYECEQCHTRLKPKAGDCCVYCSYGTVKCPPIQQGQNCCK
jgi:hypothetical protein